MNYQEEKTADKKQTPKENSQLPATEIVRNPNPRANENINGPGQQDDKGKTSGAGSEITDGEAG